MASSRLCAVTAAALGALAVAQRSVVSLDLGWRTAPSTSVPGGTCSFPIDLSAVQCDGLMASAAPDAATCAANACAAMEQVWQFEASQGCWIGALASCAGAQPSASWAGAGNNVTSPPANAPAAQTAFDDSAWLLVDLPHDATIVNNFTESANKGEAFLPPAITWYRKHFRAPAAWQGQVVTLELDAALSTSTFWLNGVQLIVAKPSGYLPTVIRLDTAGLVFSDTASNVFVAYTDGSKTTGWWYEGSGLVRKTRLVVTSPAAYIAPFGISSPSFAEGIHARASTAAGLYADSVTLTPSVSLLTGGAAAANVTVTWTLVAADGATVAATGGPTKATVPPGPAGMTLVASPITVAAAELWSVPRPYLYTLVTVVSVGGAAVDARNESVGLRNVAWDAELGLLLNEQRVKMRGFCNHESFAGVGAALPDRVDLLRVQQVRGVGGNAWRTSHNPPEPVLLDLADRLGILVLDENRVLATNANCENCADTPSYSGDPVADMFALALRDRNHASVIWYSACNEAGCGNGSLLAGDLVEHVKEAVYSADGSRSFGANLGWISPVVPSAMSAALDVMGFSHASSGQIAAFHDREPGKPLVMTECCSCETQRGEDADLPHNSSEVFYPNENSGCLEGQTQTSNGVEWMGGTFVWTMHDYVGEPDKWPHISSSFGSYDLCGFPKAPVWWYRSWWLANVSSSDAGRPPLPAATTSTFARIVESWEVPAPGDSGRTIHVYSNAPQVRLQLPGGALTPAVNVAAFGIAAFSDVAFAPGALSAQALSADGATVLATSTKAAWGAASALRLSMDAPSVATGTGAAVFLDGADVALLRVTVVDAAGNTVHDSTDNVTFSVVSGPGLFSGGGNGDPSSHDAFHAPSRPAYHGLVRGIIRAALVAAGTPAERALLAAVNTEAGAPGCASILLGAGAPPTAIVVAVSAPGLAGDTFTIPLSVDPADSVLAVAAAAIGAADIGE